MSIPEIAQQLTACGLKVFPCWDNKAPANGNGVHGASLNPGTFWPSELVGVPVPPGLYVIDVDEYKGVTTAAIEQVLGCKPDWQAAYLQSTPSGGKHYAFRATADLKQGSDHFHLQIGKGFDTRVSGKGYICAGTGYTSPDPLGVLRLAVPDSLPELPQAACEALQTAQECDRQPASLPQGDRNTAEIAAMLSYLDADCTRDEWMTVLRAIRHHFHDTPEIGFTLFDNWSMTATGTDSRGAPMYNPAVCRKDWDTTNPEPGAGKTPVTLGSLVHMAIENGYVPSSSAAEAFRLAEPGTIQGAPLASIEALLATINAEGGQPGKLDELTTLIKNTQCSTIQREALRATLQRVLKDHQLPITAAELKKACTPDQVQHPLIPQPVAADSHFSDIRVTSMTTLSGDHRANAEMLSQGIFGPRLARVDGELYWFTGSYWERPSKTDINAAVSAAFSQTGQGKTSNIDGTQKQLVNVVRRLPAINPPSTRIFFRNGVLDLQSNAFLPHEQTNYNGYTLTVDYEPTAVCPQWFDFLDSIFFAEPERIILLQEILGWMLISGNLNIQKAIALDGASRGGKGTIVDVLQAILGIGMTSFTFGNLHSKKTLSTLLRVQVGVDSDAKRPDRKDATAVHGIFNRITADEPIDIEINFVQETAVQKLHTKLLVACNGVPILADDSSAAPRRWVILKFTEDFTGREDFTLGQRLATELPGITTWCVEGLRRLMATNRFTLPQSSIDAIAELTQSSSPLLMFIDERLEFGADKEITTHLMWDAYCNWCRETNTRNSLTKYGFGRYIKQMLAERGAFAVRNSQLRGFRGVCLASCTEGVEGVTPITLAGKAFSDKKVK